MPADKYTRPVTPPDLLSPKLNTVDIWQIMGDRCAFCRASRQILQLRDISIHVDECGGILFPICDDCRVMTVDVRDHVAKLEALPIYAGMAASS